MKKQFKKMTQIENHKLGQFDLISDKELNNIVGGFAWIPFIQWSILGILGWKLLTSDKGNAKFNGIGGVSFENHKDNSHKNISQTKIIYYPY